MSDHEGGILNLVSRIEEGDFYTIAQVARQLKKSDSTIKRWINEDPKRLKPTHYMPIGKTGKNFVWLYTDEDISRIAAHGKNKKPGRPKKIEHH